MPRPKNEAGPRPMVSTRVSHETAERLTRLEAEMSQRAAGVKLAPGTCLTRVIERGVEVLEHDLGIASQPAA